MYTWMTYTILMTLLWETLILWRCSRFGWPDGTGHFAKNGKKIHMHLLWWPNEESRHTCNMSPQRHKSCISTRFRPFWTLFGKKITMWSPLEWHIWDTCNSSFIYVTPASDMWYTWWHIWAIYGPSIKCIYICSLCMGKTRPWTHQNTVVLMHVIWALLSVRRWWAVYYTKYTHMWFVL